MNFEQIDFQDISTAEQLRQYLKNNNYKKFKYILFDEIQNVEGWEIVVNGLHSDKRCDIYITGSNSSLLSGEFATRIAGRYVQFRINTLTFGEFLNFKTDAKKYNAQTLEKLFDDYLRLGGFPVVAISNIDETGAKRIVSDIYNSIVLKDIIERHKIRDAIQLDKVVGFAVKNIGNIFSAQSIVDYAKSQKRKIDIDTIYSYLHYLEESFIISKVPRYDIKGKEILKTQEKYYIADHSILISMLGDNTGYISGILENIVYRELIFRGFAVYVGKSNASEIDFIALKENQKIYIQVAYKLDSLKTIDREFGALDKINETGEKLVITTEKKFTSPISNIKHINIIDWLTGSLKY
jgi:predicted AAA+ superfamily ATPase